MQNFLMALVGVALAGIWCWAYIFTNKIAGPIFNITKKLDEFVAGDTSVRVKLRRRDYFQTLGGKVNELLDKVGTKATDKT